MTIPIILAIEDVLSETVAREMLSQIRKPYEIQIIQRWTKTEIQKNIGWVNNASRSFPYFVLTDQDRVNTCPPGEIRKWIRGNISPNLIYRFASMEVESWVMAHREEFAKYLLIPIHRIPPQTDEIPNPKEFLVKLARNSRRYRLKEGLIPAPDSTRKVGPDYNARLGEFVQEHWNAEMAARNSPSLARALRRLREFQPSWVPRPGQRRR